jgi:hypothetical protein
MYESDCRDSFADLQQYVAILLRDSLTARDIQIMLHKMSN